MNKKSIKKLEGILALVFFISVVTLLCINVGFLATLLPLALYVAIISAINIYQYKSINKQWYNTKLEWISLIIVSVFSLPIFLGELYFSGFSGFKELLVLDRDTLSGK